MQRLLFIGLSAVLLSSCSNDLDINAEYKDITVVYGLMNQRDSIHLVKINKAFLGEGNALDMALVADSNEYTGDAITLAEVDRLDGNGNVVETYPLHDTTVVNREPGTFYAPVQKLFYFRTPFATQLNTGRMFLFQDARYRLRLKVKGADITSTTPIVNDFTIDPVDQDTNSTASRVGLRNSFNTAYGTYEFNWKSKADCKRFVVSFRFRYDEVTGTDTVPRTFVQTLGSRVAASSSEQEDMSVIMNGESFFSGLANNCRSNPNWASVSKRIFRGLDFLVSVANDDFHTYLTLTEPVSGIIEDRPDFSNVGGAIGIWGSRYTKNVVGKRLNGNTLQELVDGQYTGNLQFCSALDPGGAYSCN